MLFRKFLPPARIQHIVQFFWEFEGAYHHTLPFEHPATATVSPKLAFQYEGRMLLHYANHEHRTYRSEFQGQMSSFYRIVAHENVGVFGAYFHPHVIPSLFGMPAHLLTNNNYEIGELLGTEGKELEEKIILSKNAANRVAILSEYIEKKMLCSSIATRGMIAATGDILSQRGIVDIPHLASRYALSQRQFERKFKEATGFSPKMFARIVRFEECIRKAALENLSLTEVTFALGYYDQSHMIRDFREFSGQNPRHYFAEDITTYIAS